MYDDGRPELDDPGDSDVEYSREAPAVGDAALLQKHKMHTADEVWRMRDALQTVRIRDQVNLLLRVPRLSVGARAY